ncbi:unnamed protein product [Calicophoron daubneyi]|uniref:F-BAR domain-containing protein n=1 Tax=Calicophoron daubneyi TaxID=300641 RepID=A0AAV2T7R9_CALDB
MEPCLFAHHFWGEKHLGFDTLYQNLKFGCRSTSDLAEFLRESYSIEDAYYKSLLKLAKQAGSYTNAGSFKPCWSIIRQITDQIAHLHMTIAQDRQSLSKDVQKYLEEQQKRNKSVKDGEVSTQEVVHAFQVTTLQLQKAKEVYHSRYAEYERTLRNESSSSREQEKLEVKLKKAQDEYKYSVEKYNNLRNQFVSKMHASCSQFQEIEMAHLEQMREFLQRYSSVWVTARDTLDKLCTQFNQDMTEMSTERLLNMFVSERGTGTTEPQCVSFEDAEVAAAFSSTEPERGSGGMGSSNLGVRALEAFFGREPRASSALGAVGALSKENGTLSRNSLTDLNADIASVVSGENPIAITVPTGSSKRREGFFRRRRNSLIQESVSVGAVANPTGSAITVGVPHESTTGGNVIQTSGSMSAFNIVTKRGMRRFGTPHSNGKDKQNSKQELKSDTPPAGDWRTLTSAELPKDEEGFTIPPSDPWAETVSDNRSDSDSDSGSDVDVVGRTFKGLQVKIRPAGEFAPGVSTVSQTEKQEQSVDVCGRTGGRRSDIALSDRRGNRSERGDRPVATRPSLPVGTASSILDGQNLLSKLPIPPALPPPPGSSSGSTTGVASVRGPGSGEFPMLAWYENNEEPGTQHSGSVRPRAFGTATWSRRFNESKRETPSKLAPGETAQRNLDLKLLDPLFSAEEVHRPGTELNHAKSGSSVFAWESAVGVSSLEDSNKVDIDQPAMDSSFIRRCTSAVPSSMRSDEPHVPQPPKRSFSPMNWLSFDTESRDTSMGDAQPFPNSAWPTRASVSPERPEKQDAVHEKTAISAKDRVFHGVVPEPPARIRSSASGDQGSGSSIPSIPSLGLSSGSGGPTAPVYGVSVAAAFTETWRARFHNGGGSSFSTAATITPPPLQQVSGELTFAFPATVIEQILTQNMVSPLTLKLSSAGRLRGLQTKIPGSSVVGSFENGIENSRTLRPHMLPEDLNTYERNRGYTEYTITIPSSALSEHLSKALSVRAALPHGGKNGGSSPSSYLRLDVLTYTVEVNADPTDPNSKALSPPIHLCTYWRCEQNTIDFRLDYTANWPSDERSKNFPTRGDLHINLHVDGVVNRMQSLPVGTWIPESNRATWQVTLGSTGSHPEKTGGNSTDATTLHDTSGTVRAKFTLANGPGRPQPVTLQFFREDCLASGVRLQLHSSDQYKLSLCKRRIIGDRYVCDPPSQSARFLLHPPPHPQLPSADQPVEAIIDEAAQFSGPPNPTGI